MDRLLFELVPFLRHCSHATSDGQGQQIIGNPAAVRNAEGDWPAGRYQRHRPGQTLLYRIVEEYYPVFATHVAAQSRELPCYVQREFQAYLKCGRPEHGFLRVRCESCHAERPGRLQLMSAAGDYLQFLLRI